MAGHQNKLNALLEVIHVDLQPSKIRTAHICGDDAGCNYLSGRRPVIPLDTSRAHVSAEPDESAPQVEPNPALSPAQDKRVRVDVPFRRSRREAGFKVFSKAASSCSRSACFLSKILNPTRAADHQKKCHHNFHVRPLANRGSSPRLVTAPGGAGCIGITLMAVKPNISTTCTVYATDSMAIVRHRQPNALLLAPSYPPLFANAIWCGTAQVRCCPVEMAEVIGIKNGENSVPQFF